MNPLVTALLRSCQHTIRGRLANDPDLKMFDSGNSKCRLSLAVNRPGAKRGDGSQPDWFRAEIWGEPGLAAADQLRKGALVEVTGRVSTNTWTTREGEERTDLVIAVDEWRQIDTRSAEPRAQPAPAAAPAKPATWQASGADDIDDEVPF